MKLPQPIPYQGSKRGIATQILSYFPDNVDLLIEPFAGSAAISIAAATETKAKRFHLNDINEPLIRLWDTIINSPSAISTSYQKIWQNQSLGSNEYYNRIRTEFNIDHEPSRLLYLLARCVKGSVRYNSNGEFNQSPDKRRLGRNPTSMRKEISAVSALLKGRTILTSEDYLNILKKANKKDFLYMDPPYQGVCTNRDTRYFNKFDHNKFVEALQSLNDRGIPFILSYDGRTGKKRYGEELPQSLELKRIEIHAGKSTQATLLGRSQVTYESVYLSSELIRLLGNNESKQSILSNTAFK